MYKCLDCDNVFSELGQRDEGIGSYEFWGQCCTHHEYVPCCPVCGGDYEEVEEDEE